MKVIVVMPAYYAEKTVKQTYEGIPKGYVDEAILVDDASKDRTAEVSRSLGIKTIVHERNKGYGGNQKTCYTEALKDGADIVIMLHPDYQYDPKAIPDMLKPITEGRADAVFGSRFLHGKKPVFAGGMPKWKFFGNILLTGMINLVLGERYTECHSGYRTYSRKVLETIKFMENSNDFVFDTEMIVELHLKGFRVAEVWIPTKYFKEASSIGLKRSIKYGMDIVRVLGQYVLFKLGLKRYPKFL